MKFLKRLFGKNKPSTAQDNQTFESDVDFNMSVGGNRLTETVEIKTTYDFLEKFALNQDNPDSCDREPNLDEVKVRIADITPKHMVHLGSNISHAINSLSLKGFNNVVLSKTKWNYAREQVEQMIAYERNLQKVASNNLSGKELEKSSDIQGAIALYEENVATLYPAIHAYERLMVLYHRLKDYDNEKRVIEIAIQVFEADNVNNANIRIEQHPEKKNEILSALHSCTELRGDDGWVIFNPVDVNKWKKRLEKLLAKM